MLRALYRAEHGRNTNIGYADRQIASISRAALAGHHARVYRNTDSRMLFAARDYFQDEAAFDCRVLAHAFHGRFSPRHFTAAGHRARGFTAIAAII